MQVIETNRMKSFVAMLFAAVMAFALMAGCAAEEEDSSSAASSSEQSSEAQEVTGLLIGDNSGSARSLVLTNEMGGDITALSVATVGSSDEPRALAIPGGKWANGEKATVFYGKGDSRSTYELTITVGESTYTLHNLTLSSIEEASLHTDGTFGYLTYSSGGTVVSTLGTEKGIAAMANSNEEGQPEVQAVTEDTSGVDEYYYDYYWDEDDEYADDEEDSDEYTDEDEEYYDDEETDEYYDDENTDEYYEDEGDYEEYDEGYYEDDEEYYE